METLKHFLDILLHLQDHLFALTKEYGSWVYAILFGIIVTVSLMPSKRSHTDL